MCGFAGIIEFGETHPERRTLLRMVEAIAHRGPDGLRVDIAIPAGLGHSRLRVIDLSPEADQPMWNEGRTIGVVFNGEIYNFRELRDELERDGSTFRTRSDTEVILRLYERFGEALIQHLDGMFALAIWDAKQRRLLLARDRAGKKPLFYYQDKSRITFASEIKALHVHQEVRREPNLESLPLYLTYGYFPAPETAYRNVKQLPPATVMSVDATGNVEQRRYWTLPYQTNGIYQKDEAIENLRDLMEKAVKKRLVSDVPLGAFLSGGLDSSIVVALMSRILSKPVRTFSIGFEDHPKYDETPFAVKAH